MKTTLIQSHVMLMHRIDAEVRAVLYNVYKGRIKHGPFDTIGFSDRQTAERFKEDYIELTKLYMIKYEDKLQAFEIKDHK